MLFRLLIHLSQMLKHVLICLLVGNLVKTYGLESGLILRLRSNLGPELESSLILRLGSFGLESDLKANFSGTGWYLVLPVFCAHSYYHTTTLTFCMGSITVWHLYICCTSVEIGVESLAAGKLLP